MKKLLLFLAILFVPNLARAQVNLSAASTDCTVANSCLQLAVSNFQGGATFAITANASANTNQFEATSDPAATLTTGVWVALSVTPSNSTTAVTSTTGTGVWQANVAGYLRVRIRISTFVAGVTTVNINGSNASARGGSGGGGGGGTTINATNNVLPKRSNATTFVDSAITDNGTTVAITEPITSTGSITSGSGCTPVTAAATGGYCMTEGTSTGWTPTAGFTYIRADTAHAFLYSLNGGGEFPVGLFSATPAGSKCLQSSGTVGLIAEASGACGSSAFPLTVSGTVTSGGIPYFSSTTVETSSAILNTGFLVKGGGAGGAPTNSLCDEGATTANTLTCTNTAGLKVVNVATGTSPPAAATGGTAGYHMFSEGTVPTGGGVGAGVAFPYANSTDHSLHVDNAGTDEGPILSASRNLIWNANQAAQSQVVVSATEYYITRSDLDMPATYRLAIGAGTTFHWRIALTKTAAGTGTFQILLKKGTNGSTADTSIVTQTIGTQTAAADNMEVDITLTWTSATAAYWSMVPRQSAATGTGFGLVYPAAAAQFTGTISGQTTTTASDKYGVSVIFTTGTPTFVANEVFATANGVL